MDKYLFSSKQTADKPAKRRMSSAFRVACSAPAKADYGIGNDEILQKFSFRPIYFLYLCVFLSRWPPPVDGNENISYLPKQPRK